MGDINARSATGDARPTSYIFPCNSLQQPDCRIIVHKNNTNTDYAWFSPRAFRLSFILKNSHLKNATQLVRSSRLVFNASCGSFCFLHEGSVEHRYAQALAATSPSSSDLLYVLLQRQCRVPVQY
jgi:hypothetical protein